jgi:hypothetical protein
VNKFVCVFNLASDWNESDTSDLEMEKNGIPQQSSSLNSSTGRYQADWNAAFSAIHGLAVVAINLIFIFGYLVIR